MPQLMEQVVHHIEILVAKDGHGFMKEFCSKYGFRLSAYRKTSYCQQWLVTDHQVKFLITYAAPNLKKECNDETNNNAEEGHCDFLMRTDPYVTWPTVCEYSEDETESALFCSSSDRKTPNSVFNICLAVNDIGQHVKRLQNCGVTFVRSLETISDDHGSVTLTTIRSCVGNVVHTLIERRNYRGRFLPGFISESECETADGKNKSFLFTNFDHVTLAVCAGMSTSVIQWYERCFGMARFNVSGSREDKMEDYVINLPGTALRLNALEYWKCAEMGVCSKNTDGSTNILFVIAESLPGSASNQVETFLKEHGGPGIQHVGLLTNTMLDTIDWLKAQGVLFVEPPYCYYKEIEPLLKKLGNLEISLEKLKNLGILIDVENKESEEEPRSLMQKFTKPLFEENTFFLEVIQRDGALGFGSANIVALSKSLQVMLDKKSQQLQHINSYT